MREDPTTPESASCSALPLFRYAAGDMVPGASTICSGYSSADFAAPCKFCLLRLRRNQARSAVAARAPRATPTPMPAFAPVLRSEEADRSGLELEDDANVVAEGLGELMDDVVAPTVDDVVVVVGVVLLSANELVLGLELELDVALALVLESRAGLALALVLADPMTNVWLLLSPPAVRTVKSSGAGA